MAHDQRVADRDCAFVDVEIGPADAAMSYSDEDLVMSESGPLDFCKAQFAGPSQDHGFHVSCFRQSALSYLEILAMALLLGKSALALTFQFARSGASEPV
jgi:hypothetical protein